MLLGIDGSDQIFLRIGIVGMMEEISKFSGSELFSRETETSKLANEMVTTRIEGNRSFLSNVIEIERRFLR